MFRKPIISTFFHFWEMCAKITLNLVKMTKNRVCFFGISKSLHKILSLNHKIYPNYLIFYFMEKNHFVIQKLSKCALYYKCTDMMAALISIEFTL